MVLVMTKDYLIDEATGKPYIQGKKGMYEVNLKTGKKYKGGEESEDGSIFYRYESAVNKKNGFYSTNFRSKEYIQLLENAKKRLDKRTGFPFKQNATRKEDTKRFVNYGYRSVYTKGELKGYFHEYWREPIDKVCKKPFCNDSFASIENGRLFCDKHHKERPQAEQVKYWLSIGKKPCEAHQYYKERTGCGDELKEFSEFPKDSKIINTKIGLPKCRACHKLARKEARWWRVFKITLTDYFNMIDYYENRCAICRKSNTEIIGNKNYEYWSIDHQEDPFLVRGILCQTCNLALGIYDHDAGILLNASEYVEKTDLRTFEMEETDCNHMKFFSDMAKKKKKFFSNTD